MENLMDSLALGAIVACSFPIAFLIARACLLALCRSFTRAPR
jgi:hypothetical protein